MPGGTPLQRDPNLPETRHGGVLGTLYPATGAMRY